MRGAEERRVDAGLGVANDEADRDRRSRRVKPAPEEVPAWVHDSHLVAPLRRILDLIDRLRIDPRMSRPDRLDVARL